MDVDDCCVDVQICVDVEFRGDVTICFVWRPSFKLMSSSNLSCVTVNVRLCECQVLYGC